MVLTTSLNASANTGASALAAPLGMSLLLFPGVWALEGFFYRFKGEAKPFKESLILNLSSTCFGNILALILAVSTPVMGWTYLPNMGIYTQEDFIKSPFGLCHSLHPFSVG